MTVEEWKPRGRRKKRLLNRVKEDITGKEKDDVSCNDYSFTVIK